MSWYEKLYVCGIDLFLFILIVFDWFGICALVSAIENVITPPLLMIGYTVTTIGGILYLILFLMAWGAKCWNCFSYNTGVTMREIDGMVKGIYPIPEKIAMDGQGITDADCALFSRLLRKNNTLKKLYLGNNNITDVQSIGEALKTNKTLTTLYLGNNNITDDSGIQSIIDVLKTNNTLKYLYLRYNQLSDNMKSQLRRIDQYKRDGSINPFNPSDGYQQVKGMWIFT